MAVDPTGLVQWAVKASLDRLIGYVGEANKYWDHCQDLEKYLGKIKPMVNKAIQKSQVASGSTSSAPVDEWLRNLEPKLQEAESVVQEALGWVRNCNSTHRALAVTTKKKWADKIRRVTEDIEKVAQRELPFAHLAKLGDIEETIREGFTMMFHTRGPQDDFLADMIGQVQEKMVKEVCEALCKVAGEPENVVAIQTVVEASIRKKMKKIEGAVLRDTHRRKDKAEYDALLKRFARMQSQGEHSQVDGATMQEGQESSAVAVDDQQEWQALADAGSRRTSPLASYSLQDMKAATANFSSMVGKGGSSRVFAGTLSDGRRVAVKVIRVLEGSYDERRAFLREVEIMRECRHENVLMLLGYCVPRKKKKWRDYLRRRQQKRPSNSPEEADVEVSDLEADVESADSLMLVIELAPNGTLHDHLWGTAKALDWSNRFRIIVGTAKGLVYLHHDSRPIIHRDIKPSNIFLDKPMCPKIGDFGVSLLLPVAQTPVDEESDTMGMTPAWDPDITHVDLDKSVAQTPVDEESDTMGMYTTVSGTLGFLDPAYVCTHRASRGSDIYGFGITILCIISGRLPVGTDSEFPLLMPQWVQEMMSKGESIVDSRLTSESYPKAEVDRVVHVALVCIQDTRARRPKMTEVLSMLLGHTQPVPSLPELLRQPARASQAACQSFSVTFPKQCPPCQSFSVPFPWFMLKAAAYRYRSLAP